MATIQAIITQPTHNQIITGRNRRALSFDMGREISGRSVLIE
jgi:hypothetical protein